MNNDQHLRLTATEIRDRWLTGIFYKPAGYLLDLLRSLRKDGWSLRLTVRDFCEEWGITERSFYRAKAELISNGFITEKIIGEVCITATAKSSSPESKSSNSEYKYPDKTGSPSDKTGSPSDNFVSNDPVKPLDSNGFEISPDLYSDLYRSITDLSQAERENFEHFCLLRAEELPIKPTLPKAWIQKHLEELYSQWHDKQFSSSAALVDPDCVLPADWVPKPLPSIRTDSIDSETITVQGVAV